MEFSELLSDQQFTKLINTKRSLISQLLSLNHSKQVYNKQEYKQISKLLSKHPGYKEWLEMSVKTHRKAHTFSALKRSSNWKASSN